MRRHEKLYSFWRNDNWNIMHGRRSARISWKWLGKQRKNSWGRKRNLKEHEEALATFKMTFADLMTKLNSKDAEIEALEKEMDTMRSAKNALEAELQTAQTTVIEFSLP